MIFAENAELNTPYMLIINDNCIYKVIVKYINKAEDNKGNTTVLGVGVQDEREPNKTSIISGGSPLNEWDEELYNKAKLRRKKL